MAIYTKTGDAGMTSLVDGTRVSKAHPRVEAYGNVDELNSYLGLLRTKLGLKEAEDIRRIQINLMLGSAHLATETKIEKLKNFKPEEISFLECKIDEMTAQIPPMKAFIIPSGPESAALAQVARTICRRAERAAIGLEEKSEDILLVLRYLNRLSDYLFTLGRYQCFINNISEDFWLP